MQKLSRVLILACAIGCAPLDLSAQYVYVQNEIWFDTWPGQAAGVTAVTADYDSYYWYDLSVNGFLYENSTYRGSCWGNTSGYYSASCVVTSPLNAGSEYVNHGYHAVTATYYAPYPINVPSGSQCFYSTCWWDYYGYSFISTDPYYYPTYGTYFAPGTQVSTPQSTSKNFQTESRKRAPGTSGREYYLSYKAFIPYDNLLSGNPADQCRHYDLGVEQVSMIWYAGDYRQWTYWGTSRVSQFQWVAPSQARNPSGYRNPGSNVGQSDSYALTGMISSSSSPTGWWINYNIIPEWDPLLDCKMRHARQTGSIIHPITTRRETTARP